MHHKSLCLCQGVFFPEDKSFPSVTLRPNKLLALSYTWKWDPSFSCLAVTHQSFVLPKHIIFFLSTQNSSHKQVPSQETIPGSLHHTPPQGCPNHMALLKPPGPAPRSWPQWPCFPMSYVVAVASLCSPLPLL